MPDQESTPNVVGEVPLSDRMTHHDHRHCKTYIRLLDADDEGMSRNYMARRILGIDPAAEPERARKAVESHLTRALDDRSRLPLSRRLAHLPVATHTRLHQTANRTSTRWRISNPVAR